MHGSGLWDQAGIISKNQPHANSKSQQKKAQTEPFLCDCLLTISPLCFLFFGYWVNTFAWQLKM